MKKFGNEAVWGRVQRSSTELGQNGDEILDPASKIRDAVVQVNGKVRARMEVEVDAGQEEVESLALEQPNVQVHVQDQKPKKIIVIPNRLVNIVV